MLPIPVSVGNLLHTTLNYNTATSFYTTVEKY